MSASLDRGADKADGSYLWLHAGSKTARAADVTDAEIAEVIGNLALNILTNYFNVVADTGNHFPSSRHTSTVTAGPDGSRISREVPREAG